MSCTHHPLAGNEDEPQRPFTKTRKIFDVDKELDTSDLYHESSYINVCHLNPDCAGDNRRISQAIDHIENRC